MPPEVRAENAFCEHLLFLVSLHTGTLMATLRQTDTQGEAVSPEVLKEPDSSPEKSLSADSSLLGETSPAHSVSFLGFTRGDQWFLGLVCCVGLIAVVVYGWRLNGWGMSSIEMIRPTGTEFRYRVEMNRANWVEWAQLEGLGPKLAQEIVADRDKNGPFRSIDDLVRVKGVGPTNIERFRPWLICNAPESVNAKPEKTPVGETSP